MTEGGFLAPRRPQPVKLGLVVAGHAAIIAALMLAATPKAVHTIDIFKGYNVPDDPNPPPPPRQTRQPPPRADNVDRITSVTPTVVTPPTDSTTRPVEINLLPPLPLQHVAPIPIPPPPVPQAAPVLTDATLDPAYRDALQPPYPPDLARQEITGSATVRVLIGTDGRVKDVQLVSADDPGFYTATERQARRAWRFRPATRDGVPVEAWRTMTVRFVLGG